jgi:pimeloyl-ACP methyl ester carboxylesterase
MITRIPVDAAAWYARKTMQKKRLVLVVAVFLFLIPALHAEDFFFDSDGVKIHYIIEGKGEPVILIHGFAASIAANWGAPGVIKALSENYQVIALDNRGHGQSEKPHSDDAYGLKMTADVIHLMDHLKIKKAHIVGYSMGGFMTDRLLADHPERFLTATLGGAGWMKQPDPGLETLAKSLEEGKGIGPLIVFLTPKGQPPPSEQQLEMTNKMFMAANDSAALAGVARGMGQFTVKETQLRSNKVPTLSLIGEVDPLKDGVDLLDGVMSQLKIVVIPKANHMTAFATPMFVQSLKTFLAEHPAGSDKR